MSRLETMRAIRAMWPTIVERSGCRPCPPPGLGSALLGSSSKIKKPAPDARPILPAIQYLAPSRSSGRDLCQWATAACIALCLAQKSGRMVQRNVRQAQLWRTILFLGAHDLYSDLLFQEIDAHTHRATRNGAQAAIRLDGGSDTGEAAEWVERHPSVRFWDYTKSVDRAWNALGSRWHITLSATPDNIDHCRQLLDCGGNVAAIYVGADMPEYWNGSPTVNGDAHDFRFLDPPGHVAMLKVKAARDPKGAQRTALETGFATGALP